MKSILVYIFIAIFAISCVKDEELSSSSIALGDGTAITLKIGVEGIAGESEELPSITTKSEEGDVVEEGVVEDETSIDDGISSAVMDLWVIQFSGTTDDSKIIASTYINEGSNLVGTNPTFNLLPTDKATTIVSIANSFDDQLISSLGLTLAEVKALNCSVATNLEDTSSTQLSYGNGLLSSDGNKNYFIMSCATDYQVSDDSDEELYIKLIRNAAKVTVVIKNNWNGATINTISIKDVAEKSYYYNSYLTEDNAPFPQNVAPTDYQEREIGIEYEDSLSFTYYVPVNLKGIKPLSTVESKSYYAPATSTYIHINALYDDAVNYNYYYYLGENLDDDYNLHPNKSYTYTLTFNNEGSAETDHSVETGEIDYTLRESSNCYILNPSESGDVIYYIPIQDRINKFWSTYATPATTSDRLTTSTDWDFAVLWYDNDESPIYGSTESETINQVKIEKVDSWNKVPALRITLPQRFDNDGNLVVAVYDKGVKYSDLGYSNTNNSNVLDYEILWSWHFWITDYNPDSRQHTPIDNEYKYSVDGGEIHRYNDNGSTIVKDAGNHIYTGNHWQNGGELANSFIMDRNLGSRNSTAEGQGGGNNAYTEGALYYQFGRKDPFIGNIGKFLQSDGTYELTKIYPGTVTNGSISTNNSPASNARREQRTANDKDQLNVSFVEAVRRPTVFFYSGTAGDKNWTDEATANNVDYIWNDKNVFYNDTTYIDITEKSIFDPSPLGWRLPLRGTWNNFRDGKTETYFHTTLSNREYRLTVKGATVYIATYPSSRGIQPNKGFFYNSFNETFSRSATGYDKSKEDGIDGASAIYSSYLGAYDDTMDKVFPQGASWHYREIGMPVRPVMCQ